MVEYPFALVGAWLSLVEHSVRDRGVGGSNPLAPTNFRPRTCNELATGDFHNGPAYRRAVSTFIHGTAMANETPEPLALTRGAALVLVLMFLHRPLAEHVNGLMVKGQTVPKRWPIIFLALWLSGVMITTVHDRIRDVPRQPPSSPVIAESPITPDEVDEYLVKRHQQVAFHDEVLAKSWKRL